MHIAAITLTNFRCFGPTPTVVTLDDLTAFVGTNGAGKTAVLTALTRVFGVTTQERRLRRSDFHIPPEQDPDTITSLSLMIELRIDFPELRDGKTSPAVPECFNQMLLPAVGGEPHCRVRLVGTWNRSNLPEGEVDERLSWVLTPGDDVDENDLKPLRSTDRSRIHVLYVPAARDPGEQLRNVAGTLLSRVLGAVRWSAESHSKVVQHARATTAQLRAEGGISILESLIESNWTTLQDEARVDSPRLEFVRERLEDVLRRVELVFGESGDAQDLGRLSDGLRSLFYFALVAAVFDLEEGMHDGVAYEEAFARDRLDPPAFTLFAVEEPENHLAPHYLGRVMQLLTRIAASPNAQAIVTSHSASILRRVPPERIRHFRLDRASGAARVAALELPSDAHDASKYVRQAVQAFPELYFSRLVILGEGDSEEVVLPRVAAAHGLVVDAAFVSVVPLGGRHVNHFWRLLHALEIPYVTLLDLDVGREGAGWGRIKYVCEQLLALGVPRDTLLKVKTPNGPKLLSDAELELMHLRPAKMDTLAAWQTMLEQHNVFFSAPLDLDFMMLSTFTSQYQGTVPGGQGPRIPSESAKHAARIERAVSAVLSEADDAGATYDDAQKELLPWYSYLFLQQGKPSTHLLALTSLDDATLKTAGPAALSRLVARAKGLLGMQQ